jgi:peptide/nickel transport system permease protein
MTTESESGSMAAIDAVENIGEDSVSAIRVSWLKQIVRRLLSNPSAVTGLFLLGLVALLALLAPVLHTTNPDAVDIGTLNLDPSPSHWFGTDYLGRDMWSRLLYGGRVSLPAGVGVVAIAFGVGTPIGLIAGYFGGFIDDLFMRLIDLLLCFPFIVLAIGIVAILGPSLQSSVIAVGVATIPGFARIARGSALAARERDYVLGARSMGAGHIYLLFRHVLPNIIDPLIVLATINLGFAILATAALSFLGLGTQLPTSDWGTLLSLGYEHMFQSWSEVTFPGLAIAISVLGINLLGDGLGDALNPRLKADK